MYFLKWFQNYSSNREIHPVAAGNIRAGKTTTRRGCKVPAHRPGLIGYNASLNVE